MEEKYFDEAIERICHGDREGLKQIYEAYVGSVYAVVLNIVKNRETAEDVTSEFFIRLWRIAFQYRPGYGHRAWMMTIARNMAIDELRKHRPEQSEEMIPEMEAKENTEKEALGHVFFDEAGKLVDEQEHMILTLKLVTQCTYKEISELMNMPMGTVTWKYNNAIEKLRRAGYGQ